MIGKILSFVLRYPLQLLIGVLVATIGVQTLRLHLSQARERNLGFDKLRLEAASDTLRALQGKELEAVRHIYGDSMVAVQKLVEQVKDSNTALGKALGQKTELNLGLTVLVHELNAQLTSAPVFTDATDTRMADFRVDSIPPFHVTASVALPPSPMIGRLKLGVSMDPIPVQAHVGCLAKNGDGLRPASVTLLVPPYATIGVSEVTQDREACNPATEAKGRGFKVPWWFVPVTGLLTLLGVAIAP